MKDMEKLIKAYYKEQALSEKTLSTILAQAELVRPPLFIRHIWSFASVAAILIIGVTLFLTWLQHPNLTEHVLAEIEGAWQTATVTGRLRQEGWGAEMGYPGIDLDEQGDDIQGYVFSSAKLSDQWATLDEFEGEAYERVLTVVKLSDNRTVDAFIYVLRGKSAKR